MACYRSGGCGPYEMMSCSECPASKSTYIKLQPNNDFTSKKGDRLDEPIQVEQYPLKRNSQ